MRQLVFGDIHGCKKSLDALLDKVGIAAGDQLIFLGDYIDRGPDSKGVIELLLALNDDETIYTTFLKGNHELMLLDYLDHSNPLFLINGGETTICSYSESGSFLVPLAHRNFLYHLPPLYETENYIFVHAGLRPGVPLTEQKEQDMLWIRDEFINSTFDWGKPVIYGHTPRPEPLISSRRIGLDTGAVYRNIPELGHLTCYDLSNKAVYQVDSID